MKMVSMIAGVLGVLVLLAAVYGRFHGAPTVTMLGQSHAASSLLLVGNALLLLGTFALLLNLQPKKV